MPLLNLPNEIKLEIYKHAVSDAHPRALQIAGWMPLPFWTFAFYLEEDSEYFAHIPLLAVCRQTRRAVCKLLATSHPLLITDRAGHSCDWAQSFSSISEALPPTLDYASYVKEVVIERGILHLDSIDVLPDVFPRLKHVLVYHDKETDTHKRIRELLPKPTWFPIYSRSTFAQLAKDEFYSFLLLGSRLPRAQLENSELGRVFKKGALEIFQRDREYLFLGDLSNRRFRLEVVYNLGFEFPASLYSKENSIG